MAFDENLQLKIDKAIARKRGISSKRMFGGLCYLCNGNMFCGIVGEKLMARVGPDAYDAALKEPFVSEMDFTGKPMKGMIYIHPKGIADEKSIKKWIEASLAFVKTLPKK